MHLVKKNRLVMLTWAVRVATARTEILLVKMILRTESQLFIARSEVSTVPR